MTHFRTTQTLTALTRVCLVVALSGCAASAIAQDADPAGERQERVVASGAPSNRDAAAQNGRLTRLMSWAEGQMDGRSGVRDGWYPEMGAMIPGAGLSAGPGFRRHLFGDRAVFDTSAAMSWSGSRAMQSQLAWPLLHDRVSLAGQIKYQDFTQINFFGIGNTSLKSDQTDYRLKDVDAIGLVTVSAAPWLSVTGRVGMLRRLAIEPGTSTLHPSIDQRFDETSAPGLSQQPNYLHADVAMSVDTRDVSGYPAKGGRYRLSLAMFHDQDGSRHSFRRVEAEAAQYLPIGRTVLALRGRLDLSQADAGQVVPFYMLPSLGGSNSLRGYLDYRFRDQNALLVNAEYRWPILRSVDAAVFCDTGAVAPAAAALLGPENADYGVGIRVHSATHLLVRLDVARGHEGTRALVTFSAPLGLRSSRTVVPYVP